MRSSMLVVLLVLPLVAWADSPVLRDGLGRVVGYYTGNAVKYTAIGGGLIDQVISPTGFTFWVNRKYGRVATFPTPLSQQDMLPVQSGRINFSFALPNCAGDAHIFAPLDNSGIGFVTYSTFPTPGIYYVPKVEYNEGFAFLSYSEGATGVCVNLTNPGTSQGTRLLRNDPDVTGVPNIDFPLPMTVGSLDFQWRTGFESDLS